MPPTPPPPAADDLQPDHDPSVLPTEAAELEVRIEKSTQSMSVKVPGSQAGLILMIVLVLGIVLAPPLLIWASAVTLLPIQVFVTGLAQVASLITIFIAYSRRKTRE